MLRQTKVAAYTKYSPTAEGAHEHAPYSRESQHRTLDT